MCRFIDSYVYILFHIYAYMYISIPLYLLEIANKWAGFAPRKPYIACAESPTMKVCVWYEDA
jgi:hypothetical protein